jgi:AcrR family transcriptional regulator
MPSAVANSVARRHILRAALKRFAHSGYSAASVQQIVDDAKVSKPTLYYYFRDKAGLFQALVSEAHDERYRLMREAAANAADLRGKLVEILAVLFDYFSRNRELMRISFATMFAAPGEMPEGLHYADKCERNFEFVHSLMKRGLKDGELDGRFTSRELAFGFYGQANMYLVSHLMTPAQR